MPPYQDGVIPFNQGSVTIGPLGGIRTRIDDVRSVVPDPFGPRGESLAAPLGLEPRSSHLESADLAN